VHVYDIESEVDDSPPFPFEHNNIMHIIVVRTNTIDYYSSCYYYYLKCNVQFTNNILLTEVIIVSVAYTAISELVRFESYSELGQCAEMFYEERGRTRRARLSCWKIPSTEIEIEMLSRANNSPSTACHAEDLEVLQSVL